VNRSNAVVTFREVGNRTPDDAVEYPNDDLKLGTGPDGRRVALHKDGRPY
jgi:uncharacterized cupin superfamily protein